MSKLKRCRAYFALVLLLSAGTANAFVLTEEYRPANGPPDAFDLTTYQFVGLNQVFDFRFDFVFANDVRLVQPITNSTLLLSQDVGGAFGEIDSATLEVDLFSVDPESEAAEIQMFLVDGMNVVSVDLGVFDFNPTVPPSLFTISHDFTDAEFALFIENGLNLTRIRATDLGGNDFGITRVAIQVHVVPVPSALLLLSSGLVGFAGFAKKFNK